MNSQILAKINNFVKSRLIEFFGILLVVTGIFLLLSIVSYSPSDPNFIYTPENTNIKNIGGFYGSVISDFLLQSIGLISLLVILNLFNWGFTLISSKKISNFISKVFFTFAYIIFSTTFVNISFNDSFWLIDNGNSGFVGRVVKENFYTLTTLIENQYAVFSLLLLAIVFFILSLNLKIKEIIKILSLPYFIIKKVVDLFKGKKKSNINIDNTNLDIDIKDSSDNILKERQQILPFATNKETKIIVNKFKLPSINFFKKNPDLKNTQNKNNIELNKNSEFLEKILLDFGVEGEIKRISCGPVVTLYEFEPASGIKVSKIVNLTDDIARYTSSISARLATIAISQDNYDFLKKLKIFKFSKKEFWPCSKIKLYTETKKEEFNEIFELNRDKGQKKQILYMMENSIIAKHLIRNIKKKKTILLKTQKMISGIVPSGLLKSVKFKSKDHSKYNLIIICTGSNSHLVKTLFNNQSFEHSYEEVSITTILKHNFVKNNVARQVFLNNEILALLPISNTKTSIVWSVKKDMINKYKNKNYLFFKKRIKFYTKYFLKKVKFVTDIEYKDLNLLIRKKYYQDRVLLFGDALHVVHPLAGQGFNMMLRDLASLERILKNKINLGLDIGSFEVLSDVSNETRPRNFIYSLGIDFLKNCFSSQQKFFKSIRNKTITKLNKNNFVKDIFFSLADKGFKF